LLFQLLRIFSGRALPASIDTKEREAYMGRIALSLPSRLQSLPDADTLYWRIKNWLEEPSYTSWNLTIPSRALIIVGERDQAISRPKVDNASIIIIPKAAHGTTLGPRCDLAALIETHFFSGPYIKVDGDLIPRPHPRVNPLKYQAYRIPTTIQLCLGPDCKKDGAQDVLRLLNDSHGTRVKGISCRGLCGDGPVVQISSFDQNYTNTRTFTRVRTIDALDDIMYSYLPDFFSGRQQLHHDDNPTIVSRRDGPLDLDRTKRVLLQRIVWLIIVLGVSLVEEETQQPLYLFPDRFIVLIFFLASLFIVPETNREFVAKLKKEVRI